MNKINRSPKGALLLSVKFIRILGIGSRNEIFTKDSTTWGRISPAFAQRSGELSLAG
jgi:hypothetical protein